MKRIKIRRLRQIVPTKFATAYREGVEDGKGGTPIFATWWMVWGRCFRVNHRVV